MKTMAVSIEGFVRTAYFPGFEVGTRRLDCSHCRTSTGRQLDVAHRVVNVDAPFLARELEDVAEQNQVPLDGRRADLAQALVAPADDIDAAADRRNKRNGRADPVRLMTNLRSLFRIMSKTGYLHSL
jgi:hypothetical protein